MSMSELLPCPFCGGKPVQKRESDPDLIEWGYIICADCCGRTRGKWGELDPSLWQEIRDEWNRRTPPPTAEQAVAGMLPDALVPHANEWYTLCERSPHAERITISGELASAIVATLSASGTDHAARVAELEALVERLRQEAQIHAQEARTANSTIGEIYALVTGRTGEPGNWNGAEPVRQYMANATAKLSAAEAVAWRPIAEALLEAVIREAFKMVDPFNPPTAGSYNLGHQNGIIAALKTVRDLYPRAVARTYPFTALSASGQENKLQSVIDGTGPDMEYL